MVGCSFIFQFSCHFSHTMRCIRCVWSGTQDCARHLYASPPTPTTRPHVLPSICVMNAENCWMVWQNCSFGRLFDCVWYGWIDKFIGNHVGTRTQLQPRHLTTSHAHGWGRRQTWVVASPGGGGDGPKKMEGKNYLRAGARFLQLIFCLIL